MVRLPRSQHVVGRNTPLWSPFTLTWSEGFGRSIRTRIYMYICTYMYTRRDHDALDGTHAATEQCAIPLPL
jgi:hypothetical protein